MPTKDKCETHDKEIIQIRTEFNSFKKEINSFRTNITKKLDEIMFSLENPKPIFTNNQFLGILVSAIIYTIIAFGYVEKGNAKSLNNEVRIEKSEMRDDKLMEYVITIMEDVAEIKGKENNK